MPKRVHQIWLLTSLWILVFAPGTTTWADTIDPVRAGAEALRRTKQPWYDAEQDQLRPLTPDTSEEPERAQWDAAERPSWEWDWGFAWLGQLLEVCAWGILFLLIGAVIYALVRTHLGLAPIRGHASDRTRTGAELLTEQQRIENLPVNLRKAQGDFLSIARHYYEAGNFAEAIVYLFSYRLLQLDKAGFIRLSKGKTNREYLLALRSAGDLQKLLGSTMSAFEDVFFGDHSLERERFERCWNHNEQFQLLIAKAME